MKKDLELRTDLRD